MPLPEGASPNRLYCDPCKRARARQRDLARKRNRRQVDPSVMPCIGCGVDVERPPSGAVKRYCGACREVVSREKSAERSQRSRSKLPSVVQCQDCGTDVPRTGRGVPKRCADCRRAAVLTRSRAAYQRNAEVRRQKSREYAAAHRDELLPKKRAYMRKRNAEQPDLNRIRKLSYKYGLSPEAYADLVEQTGPACPLCNEEFRGRGLHKRCVDHDHLTGKVRGLICSACNTAIGYFGDDPQRIEAAIRYLRRYS